MTKEDKKAFAAHSLGPRIVSKAVGPDTGKASAREHAEEGRPTIHHDCRRQAELATVSEGAQTCGICSCESQSSEEAAELDSLGSLSQQSMVLPRRERSQDGEWHVIRYPDQIGSEHSDINYSQASEMQDAEDEESSHADTSLSWEQSKHAESGLLADNDNRLSEPRERLVRLCAEHACQTSGFSANSQAFEMEGRSQKAMTDAHARKQADVTERGCQASSSLALLPVSLSQCTRTDYQSAAEATSGKLIADQKRHRSAVEGGPLKSRPLVKTDGRQQRHAFAACQSIEHSMQTDFDVHELELPKLASRKRRVEKGTHTPCSPANLVAADKMQPSEACRPQTSRVNEDRGSASVAQKSVSTPLQGSANTTGRSSSRLGSF